MTLWPVPPFPAKLIEIQPKQPLESRAMRSLKRGSLAPGAVAAALLLAGCGASHGTLLTSSAATQLTFELDQASSALDAYNCQVADTALTNFSDDVSALRGVNTTLKGILAQGASRITTLAARRCPTAASSPSTSTTASTTTTTGTATNTSVTTTSSVSTPTSQTSTDSGGAAPTTASTSSVLPPPAPTSATTPATSATTPDSGGAGLSDSGAGSGASGLAGGGQ
jgi:hypothetical protein